MKSFLNLVADLKRQTWPSNWWKKDVFSQSIATALNVRAAITANAGGGQGSAVALSDGINSVDTVGTIGDSVSLPSALTLGYPVIIYNNASNACSIFPPSGGAINGSTDGEFNLNGAAMAIAYKVADDTYVITGATEA